MRTLLAATLMMAGVVNAQTVTVSLRGIDPPAIGTLVGADADLVALVSGGATTFYGWDRVRGIAGEATATSDDLSRGERLWRARVRVEKGDYAGAEPILDELEPWFAGRKGPTASAGALGLLECRITRGAHALAVAPMIAYAGAVSGGTAGWYNPPSTREPRPGQVLPGLVWDAAYGLSPLVPPMWVDTPATHGLIGKTKTVVPGRAATLAALYDASAAFECGQVVTLPEVPAGADSGVRLMHEVVTARVGDAETRARARAALSARLTPEAPAWVVGWCRAGLGRSLILEDSRDAKMLGVAELLSVPAMQERLNPGLTAVCLAQAAATLDDLGDAPGAAALKQELGLKFPTHPVRTWERLTRRAPSQARGIDPNATTPETPTGGPS